MRREFSKKVMGQAALRANGQCEKCSTRLMAGKIAYDHIIPDALGGEPTLANCQVLCAACHGTKTSKEDVPRISKAERTRLKHAGAWRSKHPMNWRKAAGR
jgi:5-methylcytosine-specific restriction protein A